MRKICDDGTGATGSVVVVLGVSVVGVNVVVVVFNIEDFSVLADVGTTVVFEK